MYSHHIHIGRVPKYPTSSGMPKTQESVETSVVVSQLQQPRRDAFLALVESLNTREVT
jgi:hypothetical protein